MSCSVHRKEVLGAGRTSAEVNTPAHFQSSASTVTTLPRPPQSVGFAWGRKVYSQSNMHQQVLASAQSARSSGNSARISSGGETARG